MGGTRQRWDANNTERVKKGGGVIPGSGKKTNKSSFPGEKRKARGGAVYFKPGPGWGRGGGGGEQ